MTFSLGSQTVSAITDENGIARAILNVASGGQDRLSASFGDDDSLTVHNPLKQFGQMGLGFVDIYLCFHNTAFPGILN